MKNAKININEILNDEQLDKVSGSTWNEYREVLTKVAYDKAWRKYSGLHFDDEDNVVAFLRKEMKIKADLNGSILADLNPFATNEPATYRDMITGKALAHSQVLRRIELYTGTDK